ncbi:sensor domain-containing diguanylate cyclase [Fusibacter sp. JL216-2]|uniref:sensor domain-containing diguanylate cyclase n=1 Tax=Fusibacter sp. JL216-2 TaxID=3071453 RepID=UPI003D3496C5
MLLISSLIYITVRDDIYNEIDESHYGLIFKLEEDMNRTIEGVSEYAIYLSQFPETEKALYGHVEALENTASVMQTICQHNRGIDQFRLLNNKGQEIVRINVDDSGKTSIVEKENLQNKGDRYYFKEGMKANQGQIYMSRLDLNTEKGEVEIPHKPVLRMAVPVDRDGDRLGLVVLNYKGDAIFKMMESEHAHSNDDVILLNQEGYYLKGFSNSVTFGFDIQGQEGRGFFKDHPLVWDRMKTSGTGKYESERGWVYYKEMQPIKTQVNPSSLRSWFILISIQQKEIKEELKHLILGLQIGNVILVPLFILLGWTLGDYQIKNKYYKLTLENQARVDALTGLFNRRYANELLQYNIDLISRQNGNLSLVYIDLNNLKFVNDTYGHEMGDLMIKSAAKAMMKSVRKTDVIGRMGGDEFMIVLPDCTISKLQEIMGRIERRFEEVGRAELGQSWSMSWGFSQWTKEDDTVTDLVDRADNAMYRHKKIFKEAPKNKEK